MVGAKLECVDKTKTASSYRTLPLTTEMAQYLQTLKAQQEDAQKLIGMSCEEDGYVCCWPDGSPLKPEYVSRRFDKLLRENGLPKIRLHDLRHSAASLLLELGFPLKDIQEWLGHSVLQQQPISIRTFSTRQRSKWRKRPILYWENAARETRAAWDGKAYPIRASLERL